MAKMKKKWLYRALCAALAVTLVSGTAVMTPVADIVGTSITANAAYEGYTKWTGTGTDANGNETNVTCYWKVENGKLCIAGTVPNTVGNQNNIPWYKNNNIRTSIIEVYAEEGAKLSADAGCLFFSLPNATSMDLSNLDTSAATNMQGMFYNCKTLASLDLSSWHTSKVTDMRYMFYDCTNLTSLNLDGWNTSSVTTMERMFYVCNNLTSLDVSGWNTSSVTAMNRMFYDCYNLTSLDLSGWNTENVSNMYAMFASCRKLETVYVGSDWNTSAVTNSSYMLYDCQKLVGGNGTTYDSNYIDKTYARIDGGPESTTPGYFTEGHAPLTYTVTWKNYDGTTLETDEDVEEGTTPSYDGEKPTKAPDENGKPYYFVGWKADDGTFYDITKNFPAVSENVTYTAVFKQAVEFEQGNTYHKGDIIGVSKSTYWIGANGKDGRNVGGRWYHNHAFLITNVSYTPDWSPDVYRFGPSYVFDIKDLINGGTDTIIVYAYKVHDNAEDAGLTVFGYYESPETHTMFNKFSEHLGDIDESFITFVNSTDGTPEIVLTYPVTGEILTQGTDYKVEYNGGNTAAVIGIGRFSGELQVNCAVLPREMKSSVTNRRKAGNNAKATLSGEWYLPKNATNIQAGIARLSTDDTAVTNYDVYKNGVKKASALKTTSGKYSFSLLMNSTHANQNLYTVTYVTYEIDGVPFVSISKAFTGYPDPT